MEISVSNRQRTKKINIRFLKQVTATVLTELEVAEAELGLHLVGAKEIARVNKAFLQHAGATDVITFDHAENVAQASRLPVKNRRRDACAKLHGELFICVAVAVTQAQEFKSSWQAEVVRYVIHGVLHLLGYDDLKPHLRREMKRAENRLVRRLAGKFSFAELSRPVKIYA